MWHSSIDLNQVQALLKPDVFTGLFCSFPKPLDLNSARKVTLGCLMLMMFVFTEQAGEVETQPHHNLNVPLLDKLRSTKKQCWEGKRSTGNTHTHTPSFCVMLHAVGTNMGSVDRQVVLSCSLASHARKSTWELSTDSTEENLSESTQGLDLSIHSST